MEKFKDVERETKTKVYSKAGLAQAVKLDINQKKKSEARTALSVRIDRQFFVRDFVKIVFWLV